MIKNNTILSSFNIHPLLWFVLALAVLTGSFTEIIIIFTLIFIHEMGHLIMALFFRWRIRKVMFWPFGGVMETEEHFTKPYKEEFLVVLGGPLQHIWIHVILLLMLDSSLLPSYIVEYALTYNMHLFFFNLLPIYPLDGGKIILLLFSFKLPFIRVINFSIILSTICILIGMLVSYWFDWSTLHTISLACFLLVENRLEWKQREFVFLRHLMARYQNPSKTIQLSKPITAYPTTKVYDILKRFHKGRYHMIHLLFLGKQNNVVDEHQCLHVFFDLKKPHENMEQVAKLVNT